MCGRAKTTPRPAARYSNAVRMCPVSRIPPTSRSTGITGSRKASSQYRAYERIASLDRARSCPPDASAPITRRRFPSSTRTPVPCRRQARSAPNLKPCCAHDSGRRQTTDQPRTYLASVSLSFSPGINTFRDRRAAGLARERPRTAHGSTCCPENESRRRSSVAHTATLAWQPLSQSSTEVQPCSPPAVTLNSRQQLLTGTDDLLRSCCKYFATARRQQ